MRRFRFMTCFVCLSLVTLMSGCANPEVPGNPSPTPSPTPTPSPVPQTDTTYELDVVCNTNPELRLTQVANTGNKTVITLVFKSEAVNGYAATGWIRTGAPGQQSAFYISDPESKMEYKLINVEGIALSPSKTAVNEGNSVEFKLTFERIPDELKSFHLIEGREQSVDDNGSPTRSWTFMNVKLK